MAVVLVVPAVLAVPVDQMVLAFPGSVDRVLAVQDLVLADRALAALVSGRVECRYPA